MTSPFIRQTALSQGVTGLSTPKGGTGANVLIVNVTIAGDGRAGPYYVGPGCKAVMTVCTGACKFQMRGNGGDGPATSVYRDCTMSAEQQTASATKIGIMCETSIPYEFYLFDTSGSTNPVSMYITYE